MSVLAGAAAGATPEELARACGDDPRLVCEKVLDWTGNETLAEVADWFVRTPLKIAVVVVAAAVLGAVLRRGVHRFARRLRLAAVQVQRRGPMLLAESESAARLENRVTTLSAVLSSVVTIVIWTLALLVVLGELGVSIGPLIAGAGIAGIALGFGAQTLVRDFLAGVFILIEDQYGVGDIVDLGEASGTVEKVTLRITQLRDVEGTVWYVPNGEIRRAGNRSQYWARALIDVQVAYETDLRAARDVIEGVLRDLWQDPEWGRGAVVTEPPEVWGVEQLAADGITLRLVVTTRPAQQWATQRELRLRLKEAFDRAGIEIPFPQRTVWMRAEPPSPEAAAPADARPRDDGAEG